MKIVPSFYERAKNLFEGHFGYGIISYYNQGIKALYNMKSFVFFTRYDWRNDMIRIRKPSDDTELVRLIKAELLPYSHSVRPHDAHTIRELPKRFRWGVTYVAAKGKTGPPVAFVHCSASRGELLVDMLVTHPQHRGCGHGTSLMSYAEAYGRKHRCAVSRLFVDRSNGRAMAYYHKLGYSVFRFWPDLQCYELIKQL